MLETFILFEDKVGCSCSGVLIAAARRGVQVDVTVDGWGSPDLSPAFIGALTEAGVRVHVFDPAPRCSAGACTCSAACTARSWWSTARVAFVGGINYSADHLADFGPEAKQDYAVRVAGRSSPRSTASHCRDRGQRAARPAGRGAGRAPPRS